MGQVLFEQSIPDANWYEYFQWLLRQRRRFVVRENSMVPTLMPGDTVLAEIRRSVQVGDVVIVQAPASVAKLADTAGLLLIKRVHDIFYDGGVYVISDNAKELSARDSRHFGAIAANQIVGRVTSRLAAAP
ncbi:MAG: S26 family signal peptidase [Leptolyngbyaceae cyanobacterium]